MALVSALIMLVMLSLMAISLSMDSSMNVRIAGYQRLKARSFGFAEAGLMASADLLEDNIYERGWDNAGPPYANFEYPNLSGDYSDTIQIIGDGVFYMDDNPGTDGEGVPVMEMTGEIKAVVVVQRLAARLATGGALQVSAGYEGVGKGQAGGGVQLLYNICSIGCEANGTSTELAMHYRVVTK
jgi:hypothetical protein